ncbi:hypothetical protein Sya03_11740 [Spirilliplanes yamanashiensis]|uniref:Uncharacterized protein n=2 Tax=Spirilliplanes yamanashiensis TaxID=42233 RepID=A0A8J3Y5H1_9ACTN|nr:hypothetical protein Sya03_11740 [Spirilliplanes yamanashiensis]
MDAQTQRQHLYVNLILQNAWLHHTLGLSTKAELQNSLRHLFTSPAVREYWAATAPSRANTYVAGSEEATLAAAADEIFREYEAVLLSADDRSHPTAGGGRPARRHREAGHGQDLTAA